MLRLTVKGPCHRAADLWGNFCGTPGSHTKTQVPMANDTSTELPPVFQLAWSQLVVLSSCLRPDEGFRGSRPVTRTAAPLGSDSAVMALLLDGVPYPDGPLVYGDKEASTTPSLIMA